VWGEWGELEGGLNAKAAKGAKKRCARMALEWPTTCMSRLRRGLGILEVHGSANEQGLMAREAGGACLLRIGHVGGGVPRCEERHASHSSVIGADVGLLLGPL
jgi:hypothetical protein